MKKFNDNVYFNPKGCGPLALRQISDASDNDVMSACIYNGYDPINGGMTPPDFRAAALQLGLRVSSYAMPREPMCLAQLATLSKKENMTFVVGVCMSHVLVIKAGKVLDPVNTPLWEMVDLVMIKE